MDIKNYLIREFLQLKEYREMYGNTPANTLAKMKQYRIEGAIELAVKFDLITLQEVITIRKEVLGE